ncbi:hypothetical protein MB920_003776 [Salmonella enterica]|nr:hypothetical protein [Salmonella enterica]
MFAIVAPQYDVTVSRYICIHVQTVKVDIPHFGVIAVNIDNAIRATDESTVTVADVYAWGTAVKSAVSDVANTHAFCRIQGFF